MRTVGSVICASTIPPTSGTYRGSPKKFKNTTSPRASFALSDTARTAFINLNFPSHQIECIGRQILCDQLSELVKIQDRGITVHPTQFSRRSDRGTSHKMTNQFLLNTYRKPTSSSLANHLTFIMKIPYICQPLIIKILLWRRVLLSLNTTTR